MFHPKNNTLRARQNEPLLPGVKLTWDDWDLYQQVLKKFKIVFRLKPLTKMPADRVCDCRVREESASMTLHVSLVQSFVFGTLELNNWPMKLKCSSMNFC